MNKLINYLHFVIDDKAIRHLKSIYITCLPGNHRFIILKKRKESLFNTKYEKNYATHINTSPTDRVITNKYFRSAFLKKDCSNVDVIIFHCLVLKNAIRVLRHASRKTLIVWNPWGGDVRSLLPKTTENSFYPFTKRILLKKNKVNDISKLKNLVRDSLVFKFLSRIKLEFYKQIFDWARIDYFAFFDYYYLDLKRELNCFSPERIHLSYYTVENLYFNENIDSIKSDIQIGHAAWPSDNHLDTFSILKNLNLKDRTIIIPLNYGNKNYANSVEIIAKDIFPDKVQILKNWLELDEYNAVTENVGILIINSKVPVGFGGILAKILQGARIIIPEENIFFKIFKDVGLKFNTIEELVTYKEQLLTPLMLEEKSHNLKIVNEIWSLKNIQSELNVLYERALFMKKYLMQV